MTEINAAIEEHDDLGPPHRLDGPAARGPIEDVYKSRHGAAPQLAVTHLFLDMREAVPAYRSRGSAGQRQ